MGKIKEFIISLLSKNGKVSSLRTSMVWFCFLLPALIIFGVIKLKEATALIGYMGGLTSILAVFVTGKVKQKDYTTGEDKNV